MGMQDIALQHMELPMRRFLGLATAIALLVPSIASAADVVSAEQARTVALRDSSAVVFFTNTKDKFEVVTTVAANEQSPALRFTHDLAAGQSAVIELSGDVDTPAARLVLTRDGDKLRVDTGSKTASTGL
jgi:hypothetical protein